MILSWMIYTLVSTLLLGLAARSLEQMAWQRGWPLRGVWVLALLGSLLLSVLALVTPSVEGPGPQDTVLGAGAAPADALDPWMGWTELLTASTVTLWSVQLSALLWALWAILSVLLSFCLVLSHRKLLHRRREWSTQEVDGRAVWISPGTGPAVVGVRRSQIVLPAWVLDASMSERDLILTHEEEHVRAGDPRLLLGTLLLAVALPWNLALWWIWRRLRQAVEVDCDLRVLARGVDPRAYSRLLVKVADRGGAHHVAVVALSASPSVLERRIRLMLRSHSQPWIRTAGSVLFASVLVTAACRIDQPTTPVAERLEIWIAPTGTYHLVNPAAEATPFGELKEELRSALLRVRDPTVVELRAFRGAVVLEAYAARRIACQLGVSRVDLVRDLPLGTREVTSDAPAIQSLCRENEAMRIRR